MIGRTALALLIESKRDEEDPRVLPFYWGDDSGWARQSFAPAPQPGRLSLPSVRSNALAVGSFASQGPPSSYGETSARLLAKKRKTRADREMETVRRAQTWFAPHLVGNPCGNTSTCAMRPRISPSRTRREQTARPKIGRIDVDATELERFEVRSRTSSPFDCHAGTTARTWPSTPRSPRGTAAP